VTIDERLDRLTERHEALTQTVEAHERDMADLRKSQARTENTLRRAIRLSVVDARRQRNRNAEFDQKMTQLTAAQVVTEEKLQGLIDALRRGGNGHQ
jgi:phage-related minor tail protein